MNSRNVNQIITDRLIERIQSTGELPWQKPWRSSNEIPRNIITGKPYRGINAFLLHSMSYASPGWLTFKQAQQLGGTVKKGEHACPVVFWKLVENQNADAKNESAKTISILRYYSVFNSMQCELPENKMPIIESANQISRLDIAEQIVAAMPNRPLITYDSRQAYYLPIQDIVRLPPKETFRDSESFYSVLFHELGHSTGHKCRLNRKGFSEESTKQKYCFEELLAELTSAFLSGHSGILTKTEENSVAYLQSWLKALAADPSMLVKAGSAAQKAFDYITNAASQENHHPVAAESIAA